MLLTNKVDALIKKSTEADTLYALNNVYQTTPTGDQIEVQTVNPGQMASYIVKVENDGNTSRNFVVRSNESTETGWTVAYVVNGTAQTIGATGRFTATLAPGASQLITIQMTPGLTVARGTIKRAAIWAYMDGTTSTVEDSIGAETRVAVPQPDLQIRTSAETTYTGDSVYNLDGANQSKALSVAAGATVTYVFKLQNDGTGTDSFKINGPASASGWTIKYYNAASGGSEITSNVTSASGWSSASLAAAAAQELRVTVSLSSTVPVSTLKSIVITATSVNDATKKDAIKADTTRS